MKGVIDTTDTLHFQVKAGIISTINFLRSQKKTLNNFFILNETKSEYFLLLFNYPIAFNGRVRVYKKLP